MSFYIIISIIAHQSMPRSALVHIYLLARPVIMIYIYILARHVNILARHVNIISGAPVYNYIGARLYIMMGAPRYNYWRACIIILTCAPIYWRARLYNDMGASQNILTCGSMIIGVRLYIITRAPVYNYIDMRANNY